MSDILAITYDNATAVAQSDTVNDPAGPFAGFFTGAGGTVKVTTIQNNPVSLTNLPAGIIVPLAILRVWSAVTTASGVLGMTALPYKGKVQGP